MGDVNHSCPELITQVSCLPSDLPPLLHLGSLEGHPVLVLSRHPDSTHRDIALRSMGATTTLSAVRGERELQAVTQRSRKAPQDRRMHEPPPSWDAAAPSSRRASCPQPVPRLVSFLTCLFILGREEDVLGAERRIF